MFLHRYRAAAVRRATVVVPNVGLNVVCRDSPATPQIVPSSSRSHRAACVAIRRRSSDSPPSAHRVQLPSLAPPRRPAHFPARCLRSPPQFSACRARGRRRLRCTPICRSRRQRAGGAVEHAVPFSRPVVGRRLGGARGGGGRGRPRRGHDGEHVDALPARQRDEDVHGGRVPPARRAAQARPRRAARRARRPVPAAHEQDVAARAVRRPADPEHHDAAGAEHALGRARLRRREGEGVVVRPRERRQGPLAVRLPARGRPDAEEVPVRTRHRGLVLVDRLRARRPRAGGGDEQRDVEGLRPAVDPARRARRHAARLYVPARRAVLEPAARRRAVRDHRRSRRPGVGRLGHPHLLRPDVG